jgi:hypothetical protein
MAGEEHALSEADRKAIADIRRELDAEFGPLEETRPLDLNEESDALDADEAPGRAWSSRPGVIAAFVSGLLIGILAGSLGMAWLLRQPPDDVPRAARTLPAPDGPMRQPTPDVPATEPAGASLHEALDDWIEAARHGDIAGQMRFYPSRVPVYYTWRDVPREAVRAEKVKVFSRATRLLIATGAPSIDMADDGGSAVTRFRKRYVIEGPAVRRRGEVEQEMRWKRTAEGWVIVSERDARVLASD